MIIKIRLSNDVFRNYMIGCCWIILTKRGIQCIFRFFFHSFPRDEYKCSSSLAHSGICTFKPNSTIKYHEENCLGLLMKVSGYKRGEFKEMIVTSCFLDKPKFIEGFFF